MKTGRGWGMQIAGGEILNWATTFRFEAAAGFLAHGRKVVPVIILKESDYRKLMKNQKAEK